VLGIVESDDAAVTFPACSSAVLSPMLSIVADRKPEGRPQRPLVLPTGEEEP
jgi:hypothetical protein